MSPKETLRQCVYESTREYLSDERKRLIPKYFHIKYCYNDPNDDACVFING